MHLCCQTVMSVHLGELSYKNHRITHSQKENLKVFTEKNAKVLALTHTNNFFNLYAGGINFFGKFPHSLVWILICKRIHICSNTCKAEMFYLKSLIYMLLNTEHMRLKP